MGRRRFRLRLLPMLMLGCIACSPDGRGLGAPLYARDLPQAGAVFGPRCYWQDNGDCIVGDRRTLNVYEPPDDVPVAGVVLYVHGGAWNGEPETGGSAGLHPAARFMLAQASRQTPIDEEEPEFERGYRVLSMNYTTAEQAEDGRLVGSFPAAVYDVKAAIRFARRYYADPERLPLVVIGHSAGAHLAVLAVASRNNGQLEPEYPAFLTTDAAGRRLTGEVDGLVSLGGPLDMQTWLVETDFGRLNVMPGFGGLSDEVAEFLRCSVAGTRYPDLPPCFDVVSGDFAPLARAASPLALLDRGDPPLYVACASHDHWVSPEAACPMEALREPGHEGLTFWVDRVEKGFDADVPSRGLKSHALTGVDGTMVSQFFDLVATRAETRLTR